MIDNFDEIDHSIFMKEALKEAEEAGKRGDRPIGCVIVHKGVIVGRGSNKSETMSSDVAHAETTAIIGCAAYLKKHGKECVIYTTVEPCIMCLTTIVMANIRNVVFAVEDKYMKMGPFIVSNTYIKDRIHHYVGGVLEGESINLIETYSPFMASVVLNGVRPE
ncbi:nucleoside deaminase [Evansella sp. AB-rgal1]|uniref:nucleoside deaminase n=1 Tax=Evansella sp. AB-rgal1 TaxID=3242696 RepID=UPI00359D6CC1